MIVEPPYETNGIGLPVRGMMPMTPHTLTSIWKTMSEVQPAAMRRPVRSGAYLAMRKPAQAKIAKPASMPSAPT